MPQQQSSSEAETTTSNAPPVMMHDLGHNYRAFMLGLDAHIAKGTTNDADGTAAPILNVNLIALRGKRGTPEWDHSARALAMYAAELQNLIRSPNVGDGRVVYAGQVLRVDAGSPELKAAHTWDLVYIVEYPSLASYAKVVRAGAFPLIKKHRRAAVAHSVLYTTVAHSPQDSHFAADQSHAAIRTALLNAMETRGGKGCLNISMATPPARFVDRGPYMEGRCLLRGEPGFIPFANFAFAEDGSREALREGDVRLELVPIDTQQQLAAFGAIAKL